MHIKFWIKANGMEYRKHVTLPKNVDFAEVRQELHKFECEFQPNWNSQPTYYTSGFEVEKTRKKR